MFDRSQKTFKISKEVIIDNNEVLNIVNGRVEEYKTIKDLQKDYADKIEKIEETLLNDMGQNDLKFLKTENPDKKGKYLTKKLAYPYE